MNALALNLVALIVAFASQNAVANAASKSVPLIVDYKNDQGQSVREILLVSLSETSRTAESQAEEIRSISGDATRLENLVGKEAPAEKRTAAARALIDLADGYRRPYPATADSLTPRSIPSGTRIIDGELLAGQLPDNARLSPEQLARLQETAFYGLYLQGIRFGRIVASFDLVERLGKVEVRTTEEFYMAQADPRSQPNAPMGLVYRKVTRYDAAPPFALLSYTHAEHGVITHRVERQRSGLYRVEKVSALGTTSREQVALRTTLHDQEFATGLNWWITRPQVGAQNNYKHLDVDKLELETIHSTVTAVDGALTKFRTLYLGRARGFVSEYLYDTQERRFMAFLAPMGPDMIAEAYLEDEQGQRLLPADSALSISSESMSAKGGSAIPLNIEISASGLQSMDLLVDTREGSELREGTARFVNGPGQKIQRIDDQLLFTLSSSLENSKKATEAEMQLFRRLSEEEQRLAPELQALVQEALGPNGASLPDLEKAKKLAIFVKEHLTYRAMRADLVLGEVLSVRSGDCSEHALLLAALARSAGLPARQAVGSVLSGTAFMPHAWAQVVVDGAWIQVDALSEGGIASPARIQAPGGDGDINMTVQLGAATLVSTTHLSKDGAPRVSYYLPWASLHDTADSAVTRMVTKLNFEFKSDEAFADDVLSGLSGVSLSDDERTALRGGLVARPSLVDVILAQNGEQALRDYPSFSEGLASQEINSAAARALVVGGLAHSAARRIIDALSPTLRAHVEANPGEAKERLLANWLESIEGKIQARIERDLPALDTAVVDKWVARAQAHAAQTYAGIRR